MPSRFPISRLDYIINQADIFEISTTIQDIVEYKENCQTKLTYLKQIIGRIQEHIEENQAFLAQEEKRIM